MTTALVLTVIGPDRPGIVESLSSILARHGGNWTQSSMSALAGQFAGVLLAVVPDEASEAVIEALEALSGEELTVTARTTRELRPGTDTRVFELDLVGHDRPGIVRDITRVLRAHGVNVRELETHVEAASMAGGDLFRARARLEVAADVDVSRLELDLEDLANELMVELDLQA